MGVLTVVTHAQMPPFEWSAERRLTIQDFAAPVPKNTRQGSVQRAALSFLRIEANVECQGRRVDGSARAVFLPAESWWVGAQSRVWERVRDSKSWLSASRSDLDMKALLEDANEELLKHEQLHFDMARSHRKIRRRFATADEVCSKDDSDQLNRFVGEVTRDFRQEQARYDQETKHGTFLFAQGRGSRASKPRLSSNPVAENVSRG